MNQRNPSPDTADRLRQEIDSGKGRDKVPYPDPAAAPLGTDDEAAGTPITGEQAAVARAGEIRGHAAIDNAASGVTHAGRGTSHSNEASLKPSDLIRDASAGDRSMQYGRSMRIVAGFLLVAVIVAVLLIVW